MIDSNQEFEGSPRPREDLNIKANEYATSTKQDVVGGARTKKPTAKGMAFQAHIKWQNGQSAQRKISCQMKKIELLTEDYDNVHIVQSELKTLHEVLEDLQKTHVLCGTLTTKEEKLIARD